MHGCPTIKSLALCASIISDAWSSDKLIATLLVCDSIIESSYINWNSLKKALSCSEMWSWICSFFAHSSIFSWRVNCAYRTSKCYSSPTNFAEKTLLLVFHLPFTPESWAKRTLEHRNIVGHVLGHVLYESKKVFHACFIQQKMPCVRIAAVH